MQALQPTPETPESALRAAALHSVGKLYPDLLLDAGGFDPYGLVGIIETGLGHAYGTVSTPEALQNFRKACAVVSHRIRERQTAARINAAYSVVVATGESPGNSFTVIAGVAAHMGVATGGAEFARWRKVCATFVARESAEIL